MFIYIYKHLFLPVLGVNLLKSTNETLQRRRSVTFRKITRVTEVPVACLGLLLSTNTLMWDLASFVVCLPKLSGGFHGDETRQDKRLAGRISTLMPQVTYPFFPSWCLIGRFRLFRAQQSTHMPHNFQWYATVKALKKVKQYWISKLKNYLKGFFWHFKWHCFLT